MQKSGSRTLPQKLLCISSYVRLVTRISLMTHPFALRQVRSRFGYDCYTAKLRHRLSLFDTLQGPRAPGLQKRIRNLIMLKLAQPFSREWDRACRRTVIARSEATKQSVLRWDGHPARRFWIGDPTIGGLSHQFPPSYQALPGNPVPRGSAPQGPDPAPAVITRAKH